MDWLAWTKVIHVIAVISWMAGLLYLPRLFVYHAEALLAGGDTHSFPVMELRLLRLIMNPAMLVVWLSGLILAWLGGFFFAGWFLLKLAGVVCLTGTHMFFAGECRKLAAGSNIRSPRFYRIVNELPTVLMIFIVVCVIIKPW